MRLYEIYPIESNLVRKYHSLIDREILEQELTEIEIFFIPDITLQFVENLMKKSTPLKNIIIDNLQAYAFNIGIALGIILYDENNKQIAAYAGFQQAPHLNVHLYQAKNAQVFPPYGGKGLVGKIYKFCSEQLDMVIQSDLDQTISSKKLWTKTLPNLGIYPKIVDLKNNRIYDDNGTIEVYGNRQYCWLIDTHNYFERQLAENSILKNNRVFINSIGIPYCNPIY